MKIGLCLAGGGASGGAHVGVLRALDEAGIAIDMIAGTSSGAMVAGLFAAGITTDQMLEMLPTLTRREIDIDRSLLTRWLTRDRRGGLIRGEKLHTFLRTAVQDIALTDVRIPVAIVATDLQTGKEVIFCSHDCPAPVVPAVLTDGTPLWDVVQDVTLALAIRASISIPFIFQPVILGTRMLADGGLVDNCPVEPTRAMGADFVIAADTITPFLQRKTPLPLRVRALLQQVVNIGLARHAALAAREADVFLALPVGPIGALDFPRLSQVAERGYEYTKARIPAIMAAMRAHEMKKCGPRTCE
ncbi:MAG: patatin-like phospholipase family protein [Firmicutes bacterium]|nr:patatin-like phospholipase family protein [Bacillota bacterium]